MPKEIANLYNNNPEFMTENDVAKVKPIRHLLFSSDNPNDPITMPMCGSFTEPVINTKEPNSVTCTACLQAMITLMQADTYDEAMAYVTTYSPKIIKPDPVIEAQTTFGKPTAAAMTHRKARQFLVNRGIPGDKPEDIPKYMIGREKATFFKNLTTYGMIYGPDDLTDMFGQPIPGRELGEPNSELLTFLQNRLNELTV